MDFQTFKKKLSNIERRSDEAYSFVGGFSITPKDKLRTSVAMLSQRYVDSGIDSNDTYEGVAREAHNEAVKNENIDTKNLILIPAPDFTIDERHMWLLRAVHRAWLNEPSEEGVTIGSFLNKATELRAGLGGVLVEVTRGKGSLFLKARDISKMVLDYSNIPDGDKYEKTQTTKQALLQKYKEKAKEISVNLPDDKLVTVCELFTFADVSEYGGLKGGTFAWQRFVFAYNGNDDGDDSKSVLLSKQIYERNPFYYLPYTERIGVLGVDSRKILGVSICEEVFHEQYLINSLSKVRESFLEKAQITLIEAPSDSSLHENPSVEDGKILRGNGHRAFSLVPDANGYIESLIASKKQDVKPKTGTNGVTRGETPPSGVSYALMQMVNDNAKGPSDYKIESMALFLNVIYQKEIIPFLIEKINKSDFVSANFSIDELKEIDSIIKNTHINKRFAEDTAKGRFSKTKTIEEYTAMVETAIGQYASELKLRGNSRKIDTKNIFFKGIENRIFVAIDNEQMQMARQIETLRNIAIEKAKVQEGSQSDKILNKILNTLGVSPETL